MKFLSKSLILSLLISSGVSFADRAGTCDQEQYKSACEGTYQLKTVKGKIKKLHCHWRNGSCHS